MVTAEQWSIWRQWFERFLSASGLQSRDDEIQVSTFLYAMGKKSEEFMTTFYLSDENAKKHHKVKENHFIKRRNTFFQLAKFNSQEQEVGESVDAFITDFCNFAPLHDKMIRDRNAMGLLDSRLSEKLQIDS